MRDEYKVSARHDAGDGWTLSADDVRLDHLPESSVLVHTGSLVDAAAGVRAAIAAVLKVPEDSFEINVVVLENPMPARELDDPAA